ncbi:hypothetical protein E9993_08370 [Labilibacter sediminis]|nr:hypothetical protein E9993_08370 [Labilibacter sediminis]
MKKTLKIFGISTILISLLFVFNYCSNDDNGADPVYEITGTISISAEDPAGGAIVYLSTQANAASVMANTVAAADGSYSFMGVEKGTYYLSSTYNPANTNNLKSASAVILSGKEIEISVDGNKVQDIMMEGMVGDGDATLNLADGWKWDNTHSTIEFEFPYDAVNAVFTGHFARVGFDVLEFDESAPQNTKIKAWVDVTSVETGSPSGICGHGRDGITGCIAGSFGVDLDAADVVTGYCSNGTTIDDYPNTELQAFDLWGDGSTTTYQKQSSIVDKTGVATFESTSVMAYGNGYLAKGDFFFNGVKKEVTMYFNYLEGYTKSDGSKEYASFFGWFKFAALDDYNISSGHVLGADITVKLSVQFNKAIAQ